MNSLRDITILVFLLGSSAICLGVHTQTDEYNNNPQHRPSGLENIFKPLHGPKSIGNGQNSGSISHPNGQSIESKEQRDYGSFKNSGYSYSSGEYKPNHLQGASSYNNNGYQYMPPSIAGGGYRYENPAEVQNVFGLEYGSHHFDNNQNTAYGSGHQTSSIHKLSSPVRENHNGGLTQRQSSNFEYNFDTPPQNYEYYGNFKPASKEIGYSYNKPKPPFNSHSNFKGDQYLPGISSSQNSYQYEQKQGFQGQIAIDGYQYDNPKHPGYNYYKPQQSGQTESSFKGQSYLPKPTTGISSHLKESSSQGYSYDKPSTSFKEGSYSPLTTISGRW